MAPGTSVFPISSIPVQPWKNGGGTTRVLAESVGWRVSLAEVRSDGPFSRFEATRRQAVVVRGGPLSLRSATTSVHLSLHVPASFDGDLAWYCRLEGQVATVLNVMTEGYAVEADVFQAEQLDFEVMDAAVLVPVNCSAMCAVDDGATIIPLNHALVLSAGRIRSVVAVRESTEPSYLLAVRVRTYANNLHLTE